MAEHLSALGVEGVSPDDIIDLIYGYTGQGHGRPTEEELGRGRTTRVSVSFQVLPAPAFVLQSSFLQGCETEKLAWGGKYWESVVRGNY